MVHNITKAVRLKRCNIIEMFQESLIHSTRLPPNKSTVAPWDMKENSMNFNWQVKAFREFIVLEHK